MHKAFSIEWEIDEEDENVSLPDEVVIDEDIDEEEIVDYLSDKYGFLIRSFEVIPFTEKRKRCQHCSYLVEGDNNEWICDDCGKDIEDIPDDECSANQKW